MDQQSPASTCMDCGAALTGRWCHACGQRNDRTRLHERDLLGDLFNALFDLDSSLWRTFLGLSRHPGVIARRYIEGHRRSIVGPLKYLLLCAGVFLIVQSFLGIDMPRSMHAVAPSQLPDATVAAEALQDLVRRHERTLPLIPSPILASFFGLAFRRTRRTFAEHLSFVAHVTGHAQIVLGLPLLIAMRLSPSPLFARLAWLTWLVLFLAYCAWAARDFYGLGPLSTTLRTALAYAGWMALLSLLTGAFMIAALLLATFG